MKKISLLLLLAALTALAATTVAGAADGGRKLSTDLTGAAEVPGPGDADGSGSARLMLNPG